MLVDNIEAIQNQISARGVGCTVVRLELGDEAVLWSDQCWGLCYSQISAGGCAMVRSVLEAVL